MREDTSVKIELTEPTDESLPSTPSPEDVKETVVEEPQTLADGTSEEKTVPYKELKKTKEKFQVEKERAEEAEERARELEIRLEERDKVKSQPQEKAPTLKELEAARKHWRDEGEFDKADEIADKIYDLKLNERVSMVAADIEDRYKAESSNPDLRDRESELYQETTKVFNEMGNLTRSQAAEIAYARLTKSGKLKPTKKEKYVPNGQLGSGTSSSASTSAGELDETDLALCAETGCNPESYKKQKLESVKRGHYAKR